MNYQKLLKNYNIEKLKMQKFLEKYSKLKNTREMYLKICDGSCLNPTMPKVEDTNNTLEKFILYFSITKYLTFGIDNLEYYTSCTALNFSFNN